MNLNKLLIVGLCGYLLSAGQLAAAPSSDSIGRVIITTTNLVARQTDGSTRALRNASLIYQGDTLITGDDGMAQLRLNDGSVFSLRKGTEFKIAEYRFSLAQEPEERGLFNLIRGGFRTITGLLGKRANSDYKVTTAAATIGIRGTHYGLRLCQNGDCKDEGIIQDGLYGGVVDGEIIAENQLGVSSFSNDQYFFVAGWDKQPRGILAPPGIVFGGDKVGGKVKPKPKVDAQNNSAANTHPEARHRIGQQIRKMIHDNRQQGENLNASNLLTPAPAKTVAALAMLVKEPDMETQTPVIKASPNNTVDPNYGLVLLRPNKSLGAAVWDNPGLGPNYFFDAKNAQLKNVGSRPGLGVSWGRWEKNWDTHNGFGMHNPVASSSAHYILGNNITTPGQLGGLSGTLNYTNIIGGTKPTDHLGNVGNITYLTIGVDFDASTTQITSYALGLSFFGGTETMTLTPGSGTFADAAKGNIFIGGTCVGTPRCNGSGGLNVSGTASINFTGSSAGTAMTSFAISDNAASKVGYTGTALVAP